MHYNQKSEGFFEFRYRGLFSAGVFGIMRKKFLTIAAMLVWMVFFIIADLVDLSEQISYLFLCDLLWFSILGSMITGGSMLLTILVKLVRKSFGNLLFLSAILIVSILSLIVYMNIFDGWMTTM